MSDEYRRVLADGALHIVTGDVVVVVRPTMPAGFGWTRAKDNPHVWWRVAPEGSVSYEPNTWVVFAARQETHP